MNNRITVIFDGHCGFCTRCVHWIRRLDRRGRVSTVASQSPGILDRHGISARQANDSVWAVLETTPPPQHPVRPNTHTLAGAAAVNATLDVALGLHLFTRLYRVRTIRRAQDAIYRWVVNNRGRLPGVTPWCESHPEDCTTQLTATTNATPAPQPPDRQPR